MTGAPGILDRQERLKVLGLWPVWRLRQVQAPVAEPEPEPCPEPCRTDPATATQDSWSPTEPGLVPAGPATPVPELDWDGLNRAIRSCTACALGKSRTQGVPGVGDRQAEWLFIGEAPGADEDRQGEPFVGQAGKLLDAMLGSLGLHRGRNVYIANILKSRPPGNRDPLPEEAKACLPYLQRQIELIRPKLIVVLGRIAAQTLLATNTPIGTLRGRIHAYRGVPMVVTYHPAYLLRNPADKAKTWEDLVLARRTMAGLKSAASA